MFKLLNTSSEIFRTMLRLLPLLFSTVLLHPCVGGDFGDVGDAVGGFIDGVGAVDDTYHKVKNGVEAAQTELALATVLGMFNSSWSA